MAKKYNYSTKTGRPTDYDPKYCEELIKFFDIEPHFETPVLTTYKDGTTKEEIKFIPADLPTLAGFARHIKVSRDTINEWTRKHDEFSDAIKYAKDLQEHILITNGLKGLYAQPFAIMATKNIMAWRDKQEMTTDGTLEVIVKRES
jgi:hypothetical protein